MSRRPRSAGPWRPVIRLCPLVVTRIWVHLVERAIKNRLLVTGQIVASRFLGCELVHRRSLRTTTRAVAVRVLKFVAMMPNGARFALFPRHIDAPIQCCNSATSASFESSSSTTSS